METPRKTHPMILVAAASVTALSLAGVASLAGWLPARAPMTTLATPLAATIEQAAPVAAPVAAPAATPAPVARADAPATISVPSGSTITVAPKATTPPARHAASTPHRATQAMSSPEPAPQPGYTKVAAQTTNDSGIYVENARTAQTPAPQAPAAAVCTTCGTIQSVHEVTSKGEGTGLGAVAGGVLGGLAGSQVGRGNGKTAMAVLGAVGGAFAGHEVEKRVRADKQYQVTVRFDDGSTRSYTETEAGQWQNGDRVRVENGQLVLL